MKLLMFDTAEFWFRTFSKTLGQVPDEEGEMTVTDSLVIFVNVEKEDEADPGKAVKKAADNIAWLARKTGRQKILLHSFAHLSDSRSDPEYARRALAAIGERLDARGYEASMTPFGYFLEFKIHVKGESLAKVWKSV